MKKLLFIISFLFWAIISFAQSNPIISGFPNIQRVSSPQTLWHGNGAIVGDSGLVVVEFPDTLTANRGSYIKNTNGLVIKVKDTFFMRDVSKSKWLNFISGATTVIDFHGIDSVTFTNNCLYFWSGGLGDQFCLGNYYDSVSLNLDSTYMKFWNKGNFMDSIWLPHDNVYAVAPLYINTYTSVLDPKKDSVVWRIDATGFGGDSTLQQIFNNEIGGSVLTKLDTILTGAFGLRMQGTSGVSLLVTNTAGAGIGITTAGTSLSGTSSGSTAISGTSTSASGVQGSSTNLFGVNAISTNSYGLHVQTSSTTTTVAAANFERSTAVTNTVLPLLQIARFTSGTAANGIGTSLEFQTEASDGTAYNSNTLVSKWTNATVGTRNSQFIITNINNAVSSDVLTLSGNGVVNMPLDSLAGAYNVLWIDAANNIHKGAASGGGGSQNLQDVMIVGSTMTQDNSVDLDGFDFTVGSNATGISIFPSDGHVAIGTTLDKQIQVSDDNDQVLMYYDNDNQLAINSSGVGVTGTLTLNTVALKSGFWTTLIYDTTDNSVGYGRSIVVNLSSPQLNDVLVYKPVSEDWQNASINTLAWTVTGNTGMVWNTNFIGTTDAQSTRIRANNIEIFKGDSSSTAAFKKVFVADVYHSKGPGANYGNIAIGDTALYRNTTGTLNTAIGDSALSLNTTGSNNAAGGYWALRDNTTGSQNTAFGVEALRNNTTANYNSAFGWQALQRATTGGSNNAFGIEALQFLTTGNNNTALSYLAGNAITTGANNTLVGTNAYQTGNGSQNTMMGVSAGFQNGGNYNTGLGFQALYGGGNGHQNTAVGYNNQVSGTSGTQNTSIGNQSMQNLTSGNYNASLGTFSFFYHLTGSQSIAIGSQSAQFAGAYPSINTLERADSSIFIGYNARPSIDSGNNQIVIASSYGVGIGNHTAVIGDTANTVVGIQGNLALQRIGNKIIIPTGTNASVGVSGAMTAGTITISTTAVTASSKIFLTHATVGGTIGVLSVGTITAGTSFVINSSLSTDTSTINWWIVN